MHRVAELARQLRGAAHDCERSAAVCDAIGARDCPSAMRVGGWVRPASAEALAPDQQDDAHAAGVDLPLYSRRAGLRRGDGGRLRIHL